MQNKRYGFTLIEIAIVLVIIGLIVGGVLVGRDLIKAAEVRSQIAQIHDFNTAKNTFVLKYGYLPGDIPDPIASNFGFIARGTATPTGAKKGYAQGDGDGALMGIFPGIMAAGNNQGLTGAFMGETAVFWVDLSAAGLIKGKFTTANMVTNPGAPSPTLYSKYFPASVLGRDTPYITVFTNTPNNAANYSNEGDGQEFFGLISATIPVSQALALDKKMDDGLPQSGNVMADTFGYYMLGDGGASDTTTPTPPDATTCYDDAGITGSQRKYSISVNNGNGPNCSLSFKFQ